MDGLNTVLSFDVNGAFNPLLYAFGMTEDDSESKERPSPSEGYYAPGQVFARVEVVVKGEHKKFPSAAAFIREIQPDAPGPSQVWNNWTKRQAIPENNFVVIASKLGWSLDYLVWGRGPKDFRPLAGWEKSLLADLAAMHPSDAARFLESIRVEAEKAREIRAAAPADNGGPPPPPPSGAPVIQEGTGDSNKSPTKSVRSKQPLADVTDGISSPTSMRKRRGKQ